MLNSLLLRRILINNLRKDILGGELLLEALERLAHHHLRRSVEHLLLLDEGCHWIDHSLLHHHHLLLLLEEDLLRSTLHCLRDFTLGNLANKVIDDILGVLRLSTYLLNQALCNHWVLLVNFLD